MLTEQGGPGGGVIAGHRRPVGSHAPPAIPGRRNVAPITAGLHLIAPTRHAATARTRQTDRIQNALTWPFRVRPSGFKFILSEP